MKYLRRFNESQKSSPKESPEIHSICQEYGITNWTINQDGSIDVVGDVDLSYQRLSIFIGIKLTELPLKFGQVGGSFYCNGNQLTSLAGAPERVGGYFSCDHNQLTSLTGAPTRVGGGFYCRNNQLTSLTGVPKEVGGNFFCSHNQLTSLTGAPESIGGDFSCYHNPVQLIFDWFQGQEEKFLDKINFIYTDLWLDPVTVQLDVLEQIAEELEIKLPANYRDQLLKRGYQVL